MPTLPDGEPVPPDGSLPASSLATVPTSTFGIYLHVPFCAVRCGYCDFNTYTLGELGPGASLTSYAGSALAELDLAHRVIGETPPVATVFVGGGTPTMLQPDELVRMLDGVRDSFGLAAEVEVTTEANPDSVTPQSLQRLADGGFTRVSLGMQSAVPSVLHTLDRTHDPDGVGRAVDGARAAGLQVSLDLIYGTPGESLAEWQTSLEAAIDLEPDHISAYALTVEDGTALARKVRRGELPTPTGDDEADKYELAESFLATAGFGWYEISNWSRSASTRCRHNEAYWSGGNWWGIGPGAHSHVGGVRWWNVKHPARYAAALGRGESPGAGRELLTAEQREDERVLLGIRRVDGLPLDSLSPQGRTAVAELISDGLIVPGPALRRPGRVVLTVRGRLLADTVVRRILGW